MIPELADALHLDFETRSIVDLRQAGPYVYAEHWSTEVGSRASPAGMVRSNSGVRAIAYRG